MTAKKDDTKKAGTDTSKDVQTTKEAEDQEVPTKVEERGETDADAAASGSSVGAVREGDSNVAGDDEDWDVVEDDTVTDAEGTVVEVDRDGVEYDVPYVTLTTTSLPRTSDSDDGDAVSWTSQERDEERKDEDDNKVDPVGLVPVAGTPGQTFDISELPNRDVVEKAGIDYDQFVAGLPVRGRVPDAAPRRGIPA